jgi:hypothetical protein
VFGWLVEVGRSICDAVGDRLLDLRSWLRPGIPDAKSHKHTVHEHPIWTSQYIDTFSGTVMAISRYLASRIRAQGEGTTIHVVGKTSTGWIDRGSFDLPALCFSRSWGCLTATPTRHDTDWGHRKPKSGEGIQRSAGTCKPARKTNGSWLAALPPCSSSHWRSGDFYTTYSPARC